MQVLLLKLVWNTEISYFEIVELETAMTVLCTAICF